MKLMYEESVASHEPVVIVNLRDYKAMENVIRERNELIKQLRNCYSVETYELDEFGQPAKIKLRISKTKIEKLITEALDLSPEEFSKTEWI